LAGKLIKDTEQFIQLANMYENMKYRENEVQEIIRFVDEHPDVFEISEDEAILDDCNKVLEELKFKIENDF